MLAPGTVIASRYTIERFLAAGGMGAVYVAFDASMKEKVALKLSFARPENATMRARFGREARIAHRLGRLPGIVRALDWGEAPGAGALYMVLDFVADAKPLDLAGRSRSEAVARVAEAARIVARAHAAGVVHRDLKPENFLVDASGAIWLSDFGIAKLEGESELLEDEPTGGPLTASNQGFGTPLYMSPEQLADAKRVDARTDVYALGVLLFVALTGHFPFRASSIPNLIAQHERILGGRAPAPRPSDHDPAIPASLDAIVARATALDRAARTPTAEAFARELESYLAPETATAPSPAPAPPPAPAPGPPPVTPRGSSVAGLAFRLGVVPILAGREWIEEEAFAAVEDWERFLVAKRHPGAALEVARLAPRKGDRGPLRLPHHEPFTNAVLEDLGAKNQLWRAFAVQHRGAWAILVRLVPAAVAEDPPSWETTPEAEGSVWSAPVAHDEAEVREALGRFRACDRLAREPVAAYRDMLSALGRLSPPREVVGPAIPEAFCAGCSVGSFHGLLAALAREELAPGSNAAVVFRQASEETRVTAADLARGWHCPRCGGETVRLRFAPAWDETRAHGVATGRVTVAGERRVAGTGDPIAVAVRLVTEKRRAGRLVVVVSTRRRELDAVAARLRAVGLPEERVVRRAPSGVDRPEALAAGAADCLLVEVGADGPGALALDAFPGEIEVVVTSPETLPTNALDAVERAIASRRTGR